MTQMHTETFYGTEYDTYYVDGLKTIWHVQSVDGGEINEVETLPTDAEMLDPLSCLDIELPEEAKNNESR